MIYGWSPVIGDPDALGWLTVVAYFVAAWLCYLARARIPTALATRSVWTVLVVILCALGVNKQLDLQSLGTAVMRHAAHSEGWYDARREAQALFVLGTGVAMILATIVLAMVAQRVDRWTKLAIVGLILLLSFVTIRAVSFHHVDALIGTTFAGVRLNHVLELGGIAVIGGAALCSYLAGAGIERVQSA